MPTHWNINWLNHNSQRIYPFAEHASCRDVTGTIRIPDDFLVELYLPVASVLDTLPDRFYLKTLSIFGSGVAIEIGYDNGESDPPTVASASIATTVTADNTTYALPGINDFSDTVGKFVIGSLTGIAALPGGVYTFAPDATPLDPDAIRPMIRGVSSVVVESGGNRSPRLYNDLVLAAGANIQLTTIITPGEPTVIRWDAIGGAGFSPQCDCVEQEAPCIRTINGIPGDEQNNFTLLDKDCLQIQPIANGLQLLDTCCEPCCGCPEMEEVLRVARGLQSTAITLDGFAARLESQFQLFVTNALVSSLTVCFPIAGSESESEVDV